MKVKGLIEKLQEFDQDIDVECMVDYFEGDGGPIFGGCNDRGD